MYVSCIFIRNINLSRMDFVVVCLMHLIYYCCQLIFFTSADASVVIGNCVGIAKHLGACECVCTHTHIIKNKQEHYKNSTWYKILKIYKPRQYNKYGTNNTRILLPFCGLKFNVGTQVVMWLFLSLLMVQQTRYSILYSIENT